MTDPPSGTAALRSAGVGQPERGTRTPPDDVTVDVDPSPNARPTLLSGWVAVALLALVLLPLVVAVGVLRGHRWYPFLDLAMTELRVRDVFSREVPLIGLPGRIGVLGGDQGSHPGPISFWMLAPVYRIFGSSAWSLQVATVWVHGAAMAAALLVARRRVHTGLLLGVGALLALLVVAFGAEMLTEPWNPYLPLFWWLVMLLAVWSVLDGDLAMLPVAVLAGSFCAQTHAPYMLLVLGTGGLALGSVVIHHVRSSAEERRRALVWVAAAVVAGCALWAAPLYDQLRREPGNISLLIDHFLWPSEEPVGIGIALEQLLLHLDPWRLVGGPQEATGSLVYRSSETGSLLPGLVVLVLWAASVVAAVRMRHGMLRRLHLVIGVALLLGVVSISRIFGDIWYYLLLWSWVIAGLLLLAVVWSAAALLRHHRPQDQAARRAGGAALATVGVLAVVVATMDAADVEVPGPAHSEALGAVVPATIAALGEDPEERYLVMWSDGSYIGSYGMGLVNELDREGFDVGVIGPWGVPATRHRVVAPEEATTLVHLATGVHVERWREKPGVWEIASHDPRSADEVGEHERLRGAVLDDVADLGLTDELLDDGAQETFGKAVDENLLGLRVDPRLPEDTRDEVTRLLDLGTPIAVFVGPVDRRD